jgi:mevalonate pyrophosphate decarboxylase
MGSGERPKKGMMLVSVEHTDFDEQRAFIALSGDDKLLRIWLNGRETNGKVADVMRDMEEMRPKVQRHDRWMIGVTAIGAVSIALAPFVFFILGKIWI